MGRFSRSFQPRNSGRVSERLDRAPTFSYRANRVTKEESVGARRTKVRTRRINLRWQHVPTYIVGGLGVLSVLYILSLTTTPKLVVKRPANEQQSLLTRSSATYQSEASKILSGNPLNRSKVTIDTAEFNRKMTEKFPEIRTVAVTLPLMGRRPIVEVIVDQPAILYKAASGEEYVLNGRGRVIRRASEVRGIASLQLPSVTDQAQKRLKSGDYAMTEQGVDFITTFIKQLSAKNIKVTEITIPPLASEVQFRLSGVSYFVKASLLNDARQSAGTFLALKKKLEADTINPAEYIDVRVEEKAYVK